VPATQLTSYTTGDRLPAATIEKSLDKLTMLAQQGQRSINTRSDEAALSIKDYIDTEVSNIAIYGATTPMTRWAYTGDGTTVAFAVTGSNVTQATSYLVTLDGVTQDPASFTIAGSTLTFSEAPPTGAGIVIVCLGYQRAFTSANDYSVTATRSTTARTLANRFADVVNVKDFGATGNGTTDDTSAFNAAIAVANDQPILLPSAYFNISSSLNTNARLVWDKVTVDTGLLSGYGYDQTKLPLAPALNYGAGERFIQSFRNSKVTGYDIYGSIFPSVESYDGVQGVTEITSGSNIENASGLAGYIQNNSTGTNGVCIFGVGQAVANSSKAWGVNTLITDSATRALNADTGKYLIGYECDINIMSPNTNVIGISIGGNSLSNTTQGQGFVVNSLGTLNKWAVGFITGDGTADIGIKIGANTTTGASDSQKVILGYRDSTATVRALQITQTSTDFFSIVSTSPSFRGVSIGQGNLFLNSTKGVWINGTQIISNQVSGWNTPIGATSGTFDATTATLSQTASFLAGVILALKTHGLIGP
jgi:hypothetical protein